MERLGTAWVWGLYPLSVFILGSIIMALKGVQLRQDCVITEHNSGHRPPSTQNMDRPTRLTS